MKGTKTLLSYLLFIIGLQWKTVYALPGGGCDEGEFMCKNKEECIVGSWKCDGEKDCSDGSDEVSCTHTNQRQCDESVNFKCKKNNKCVPKSWTCDKVDDCGDGSDESSVDGPLCLKTDQCARDDFKCVGDGVCILRSFVCDGYSNCKDGSDEKNCDIRKCADHEFKCKNNRCISKKWHCDRSDDCGDASDEEGCKNTSCAKNEFQCVKSGHCIRGDYRCDETADCLDGSDEVGCKTTTPRISTTTVQSTTTKKAAASTQKAVTKPSTKLKSTTTTTIAPCKSYDFTCGDKTCVHKNWLCDGEFDCPNGEDESDAVCKINQCKEDQMRCTNGQCIDVVNKCDGINDCNDGLDEKNCPTLHINCSKETFKCNNSTKCLDPTQVCNSKKDCPEGDDESNLCNVNECATKMHGCSDFCGDLKIGHRCYCRRGFKLAKDNRTCVDINECLIPGMCTQGCVNFKGSYACECDQGYKLDPNNKRTCRAEAPVPYIVFSNRFEVRQISTSGRDYNPIVTPVKGAVAVAADVHDNMIYWADSLSKTISRTERLNNGNNKIEVLVKHVQKPEGLAVDWVGKKLYWTDAMHNRIFVSNLDGSSSKIIFNGTTGEQFRALTVYPEKGLIYWTNWGQKPKIESAQLDGSNRKTVVDSKHVTWPSGVAIDNTLERIYWTDLKKIQICSSKIDGSDVRVVVQNLNSPYGLTVFEEYVYWTDFTLGHVYKANKFTGKNVEKIQSSVIEPMGITVFHPLAQKKVSHPCQSKNGNCSHLCFVSPTAKDKYICDCPDFLKLDGDQKTCIKVKLPTTRRTISNSNGESTLSFVNPSSKPVSKGGNSTRMIIYGCIGAVILLIILIIVVILYRRRAGRFDLRMIYETQTELVHSKGAKDRDEVEVKYVTNPRNSSNKKNKNFENVNFRDEAKMPLQMSDVTEDMSIEPSSDDSSGDVDFDDTKPIVPHMV